MLIKAGLAPFGTAGAQFVHSAHTGGQISKCAWDYLIALLSGEVMWLRRYSHCLPGRLFALLDEQERPAVLCELQTWRSVLLEAEEKALDDADIQLVLDAMPCHRSTWVRECMIALSECEFNQVPPNIVLELEEAASCMQTTKIVEDCFNVLRDRCRHTKQGSMGRMRRLATLSRSSLLADSDRPGLPATPLCDGCHRPVEEAFARPCVQDFSLGEDFLEQYLQAPPGMSASCHMSTHMAWCCLLENSANFNRVPLAWLSLLPRRGHLLHNKLTKVQGIVLATTIHGVLLMNVDVDCSIPCFTQLTLNIDVIGAKQFFYVCITDVAYWRSVPVEIIPTSLVDVACPAGAIVVHISRSFAAADTLLQAAALDGFRGFTVAMMHKLMAYFEVPYEGRRPVLEADIAALLVSWALPDLDDEEVDAIVQLRSLKKKPVFETVLTEQNADVLAEAIGREEAKEDIMETAHAEFSKKKKDRRPKPLVAKPRPKPSASPAPAPAPAASGSGSAVPAVAPAPAPAPDAASGSGSDVPAVAAAPGPMPAPARV